MQGWTLLMQYVNPSFVDCNNAIARNGRRMRCKRLRSGFGAAI
jgi:hypothetical protein